MQIFGFLRIHDAKVGAVAKAGARLDFAIGLTWFVAAVLLSPTRMGKGLGDYYRAGGGAIAPPVAGTFTSAWLAATRHAERDASTSPSASARGCGAELLVFRCRLPCRPGPLDPALRGV